MLVNRDMTESGQGGTAGDGEEEEQGTIYAELAELAKYVEMMTSTIRDMETPVASTSHQLPQATKHLNDLAQITEEGTHQVLTLTEDLESRRTRMIGEVCALMAQVPPEAVGRLECLVRQLEADKGQLMNIHVALSFQDLVAQRVGKLVTVLNEVQHKLLKLVVIFGMHQQKQGSHPPSDGRAQEMLKQLDASKTTALKQQLVDDILSEFGCA